MYNICRINKEAQIVNTLLGIVFHKVYKVSLNSTTHKTDSGDVLHGFLY